MKRGISSLIAVVLLTSLVVIISTMIFIWGFNFAEETTETAEHDAGLQLIGLKGAEFDTEEIVRHNPPYDSSTYKDWITITIENTGKLPIDDFIVQIRGTEGVFSQTTLKAANVDLSGSPNPLPLVPFGILKATINDVPNIGTVIDADVTPRMQTEFSDEEEALTVLEKFYDVSQQKCEVCPKLNIVIAIDHSNTTGGGGIGLCVIDPGPPQTIDCTTDPKLPDFGYLAKIVANAVFAGAQSEGSKVSLIEFVDDAGGFNFLGTFSKTQWENNGFDNAVNGINTITPCTFLPSGACTGNCDPDICDEPQFNDTMHEARITIENNPILDAGAGVVIITDDAPDDVNRAITQAGLMGDKGIRLMIIAVYNDDDNDKAELQNIADANGQQYGQLIYKKIAYFQVVEQGGVNSKLEELADAITSYWCSCTFDE